VKKVVIKMKKHITDFGHMIIGVWVFFALFLSDIVLDKSVYVIRPETWVGFFVSCVLWVGYVTYKIEESNKKGNIN
jgi:hypothetical protein